MGNHCVFNLRGKWGKQHFVISMEMFGSFHLEQKLLLRLNSWCTWYSPASKKYVSNKNSLVPVLKTCHLEKEKKQQNLGQDSTWQLNIAQAI